MLATLEINPSKEALSTVIWLHGLGADGHDFESIVPQLGIQERHQIRFIFPHAPTMPVTINGGMVMPAWFNIYEMSTTAKLDLDGITQSKNALEALIQNEINRGIASTNIIIAGFSQGAVMALTTGLLHNEPLAGIIALSGYLPNASTVLANLSDANKACPIFLAHGTHDPIVPYPLGLETYETLVRAKLPLAWHSYYMPHSVCAEEIKDIGQWISDRLQGTIK